MTAWNGRPRIVVGVDGSGAALTAVRYAAREARRCGADLDIAHATPHILSAEVTSGGAQALTPEDYRGIGLKLLNRARKVAREVTGDTWQISTSLLDGAPAEILAAQAADARMIVLGDQRRSLAEGVVAGAVVAGVVDAAEVPVVVVPERWVADAALGVVAVGVDDILESERLLRRALAIAAIRGATLRIVHAWELPAPYDQLVSSRIGADAWSARVRLQIEQALDRVRPEFPRVAVEVQLVHGQPASVLRDASRHTDLLLLSRGGGGEGRGRLGGTGRAALRESGCPVEVLPLAPSVTTPGPRVVLDPVLVG